MMAADSEPARRAASAAFDPRRWGCQPGPGGWDLSLPGIGAVRVARLGWPQAQSLADPNGTDALAFLARLQGEVWGMPSSEWVPANLLAVLPDTGGSVLAAYRAEAGWTREGWLGFAIGAGGRDGVAVSHMLGVREDARGGHDLGWLLKAIQGYEALESGHHAMTWTFDPLRGANARLNLEKLGATVSTLTIDKYGPLRSALYGDVPSDRFTAEWDLLSPRTHRRLADVFAGAYRGPGPAALDDVPLASAVIADALSRAGTPLLRYAIPGDIDRLQRDDPARAVAWRAEMRATLGPLLDVLRAEPGERREDPAAVTVRRTSGAYRATGFRSEPGPEGERRNEYLLARRDEAGANTGGEPA